MPQSDKPSDCTYVLITGANTGLGFATCCRLADEFLTTRATSQSLKLIVSTRSAKKSKDTISRLQQHVDSIPHSKSISGSRISFHTVQLDLASLRSVRAAAQELLSSVPKIDTIICNAGIAGPITIDWPQALWAAVVDPIYSVTFPYFAKGSLGLIAKPQLPTSVGKDANESSGVPTSSSTSPAALEPPLGEIFSANIFGHYLLAHALTPLLAHASHPPARIICVSSLETPDYAFSLTDLQGLTTTQAYHSSKRLTDILALTASLPTSKPYTDKFFTPPGSSRPLAPRPRFYVCHPGVCATEIFPLFFVLAWIKILTFYIARWLGSPWHTISTRKGACALVWLALAAQETLDGLEEQGGLGKWGSATDAGGSERVRRTEVDGWGYGGKVGQGLEFGNRGRRRGAKDLTVEDREAFEDLGREAWKEMEALREEWEERLGWGGIAGRLSGATKGW
ncbi:3-keto-steroid reductase [Xylographa vitiligo]|nr:3-keto-steroid reductase [Xylographa vitiligo]